MTSAPAQSALVRAGGEALWRTNPVLCVDRLLAEWSRSDVSWAAGPERLRNLLLALHQKGVRVPPEARNRWAAAGHIPPDPALRSAAEYPAPRVIGLAVDAAATGYVYPLNPIPNGAGWRIDPDLPFTPAHVQDGLAGLLHASAIPNPNVVPERLAYTFDNPTRMTARGDSMTVAAVLAVLDQMSGRTVPLFRAAVALVELLPGGRLGSVSSIPAKLGAARRECGALSLLVCGRGVAVERRPDEPVWEVETLDDLARHLHAAGLLGPLLGAVAPLTRSEAARVLDRLRGLIQHDLRYRDAAELGDRVRRCAFAHPPDPAVWVEFARLHAAACRHNGRFADAVSVGRDAHERVADLGDLGCDDEEADAAAEYAASLYSGHRFDAIPPILDHWARAAARDPRRFRPLTRVKVWNTLGRALAVLGPDGWDDLFGRSLDLHRRLGDTENFDRTIPKPAPARRRRGHGDRAGARAALAEATGPDERAGAARLWAAFLHANLARLEDRAWTDHTLDGELKSGARPYSAWLYVQATARQPTRERGDALARLEQAAGLLRHEADGVVGNVCNLFAEFLELNAAARADDVPRWAAALASVRGFLSAAPDYRAYYAPTVDALPVAPDLAAAEALLDRVPYF